MSYFIATSLFFTWHLLTECAGAFLLIKPNRPQGKIQSGKLCVDATTRKASLVDCVDVDLSKVFKGNQHTLCNGSMGVGTYVPSAAASTSVCTSEGQLGCVTDSTFKSVNTSTLLPSYIAWGKSIVGVTGTKRDVKQYCNAANLSLFDISPTSATVNISSALVSVAANTITINDPHGLATNDQTQLLPFGLNPPLA